MKSPQSSIRSFIFEILWPYRWYIVLQAAAPILWAIERSTSFYFTKKMIDSVSCVSATVSSILPYAFGYVGISISVSILYRTYDWLFLRMAPRLEQTITEKLTERLLNSTYQFYQGQIAGGLANQVREVANGIPLLIDLILKQVLASTAGVVIALWTLFQVNGVFAFLLGLWVTGTTGMFYFCFFRIKRRSFDAAQLAARVVGQNVDIFNNIMSVRLFGTAQQELNYIHSSTEQFVAAEQKRSWLLLFLLLFNNIMFTVSISASLWFLIRGTLAGTITPGDFALILGLGGVIGMFIWFALQNIPLISKIFGTVNQALHIIMNAPVIHDRPEAAFLRVSHGQIVFDTVTFQYPGAAKPFFHDLSITISSGQKIGLVGYSGSGKSTFVNLILRLFEVTSGRIVIDHQDIAYTTHDSLVHSIAYIPQDPTLFHRSLYDNIAYGQPQVTMERVIAAAKQAHAHDFIMKAPHGYQTIVGDRGIKLSGGQKQRIAIARAILKDAPILVMDEATSQLDSVTEHFIQESIWEFIKNKTTIVIAHRLSTLQHMDRILVFDQGIIVEDGTHEQLLAHTGLYATLWNQQVGGFLPDKKEEL